MQKNYYTTLGVTKSASDADIKKAYKKLAMQYHPDRNKGDKKAEEKFKEINEAYQVLGDPTKKKNYDQFGSAEGSPFSGGNPFSGGGYGNNFDFSDVFSQFGGMGNGKQAGGFEFDISDLFSGTAQGRKSRSQKASENFSEKEETANLHVTETVEIPFFDFLYDTSISVKTVYGKTLSLKIKAGTKPGTKFKIAGKGRTIDGKTGDMYVIVDAKMPKMPLDPRITRMIEAIKYEV